MFISLSDLYICDVGLLQVKIMSPFLFSFFLADIEVHLKGNINDGIYLELLQLYFKLLILRMTPLQFCKIIFII